MNNFGKMTLISTLVILFMSGIIILLLYNYNNTLELKAIYENALEKYEMENSDEKILIEGRHDPAIIHRAAIVQTSCTAIAVCDMLLSRFGTDWLRNN